MSPGFIDADAAGEVRSVLDRFAVQFGDDVAGLQARLGGGRAGLGLVDQGAAAVLSPSPSAMS